MWLPPFPALMISFDAQLPAIAQGREHLIAPVEALQPPTTHPLSAYSVAASYTALVRLCCSNRILVTRGL